MADRRDLDFTYSLTDRVIRLSLGELADFSGAKYDGDFSLTLEQAQHRKHEFIAREIGVEPGRRVLDLGCGWGALLNDFRARGATGLGVTLSSAQVASCVRHGLDVRFGDARQVTRETYGDFDAAVSLGAFEHFCTPEDHTAGRQEAIYREFFEHVAGLLPATGRFYLQTMVFGERSVPMEEISTRAPWGSDAWVLAVLGCQFPGSWLPSGHDQIVRCAAPGFRLVSSESGRHDYIETINQWNLRIRKPSLRKWLLKLRLLPRWLTSREFRLAFTSGVSANQVCFQRQLLNHHRMVFERV
jgi:cyclopropane-fatty-acyl-phospholipid synthase